MSELSDLLVHVAAGETIFSEGDLGEDMYFVYGGTVRIERRVKGQAQVLATLEKGDFFGEMSLLEHEPRSADAVADSDCTLLKVGSDRFLELLASNAEIAVRMIRKYISRVRDLNTQLITLSKEPTAVAPPASAATPMPTITLRSLEHGINLTYQTFPLSIGRFDPVTEHRPNVDLSTIDKNKTSSRRHARITYQDGQLFLTEDIGVANGTFLNGERLVSNVPARLRSGDTLRVGDISMTVEF